MRRRLLLAAGSCAVAAAAVWAVAFHVAAVRTTDLRVLERMIGLGGPRGWALAGDVVGLFDERHRRRLSRGGRLGVPGRHGAALALSGSRPAATAARRRPRRR